MLYCCPCRWKFQGVFHQELSHASSEQRLPVWRGGNHPGSRSLCPWSKLRAQGAEGVSPGVPEEELLQLLLRTEWRVSWIPPGPLRGTHESGGGAWGLPGNLPGNVGSSEWRRETPVEVELIQGIPFPSLSPTVHKLPCKACFCLDPAHPGAPAVGVCSLWPLTNLPPFNSQFKTVL